MPLTTIGPTPAMPGSFTLADVIATIEGHVTGRARLDRTYEIR